MGKNWRGGYKGFKGGGGNDIASCRGHGIILATCDAAKERETSKELVNLFTQCIEDLGLSPGEMLKCSEGTNDEAKDVSIQSMLKSELELVRNQSHKGSQAVMSVKTGIKGIVIIKVMRKDVSPIELVRSVFIRIKDQKIPCTRHAVRIVPLQRVFYPNEEDLFSNLKVLVEHSPLAPTVTPSVGKGEDACIVAGIKRVREYADTEADPDHSHASGSDEIVIKKQRDELEYTHQSSAVSSNYSAQDSTDALGKESSERKSTTDEAYAQSSGTISQGRGLPYFYSYSFKARNHNTLNKGHAATILAAVLPKFALFRTTQANGHFIIEVLQNIGCASFFHSDYASFEDFNVRKYQQKHCLDSDIQDQRTSSTSKTAIIRDELTGA